MRGAREPAAGSTVLHTRSPGEQTVRDVVVVLLSFAAAAVLAGALWPQLVDPVLVERTELGLVTSESELGDRFDTVGWYSLLGGGLGVLLGVVLAARRRGNEVVTLVAVVVGSCLAAWLSARLGTWLGPDDPTVVLADASVGDTAEEQVRLTADVGYLVWPIATLIGSVVVLWSRPASQDGVRRAGRHPNPDHDHQAGQERT